MALRFLRRLRTLPSAKAPLIQPIGHLLPRIAHCTTQSCNLKKREVRVLGRRFPDWKCRDQQPLNGFAARRRIGFFNQNDVHRDRRQLTIEPIRRTQRHCGGSDFDICDARISRLFSFVFGHCDLCRSCAHFDGIAKQTFGGPYVIDPVSSLMCGCRIFCGVTSSLSKNRYAASISARLSVAAGILSVGLAPSCSIIFYRRLLSR
jgi:hypothetical protein